MNEQSSIWDVDYSASPSRYDLRPAVKAIMAAENWLLSRQPDQKLVIIIGESHGHIIPSFLQMAVLKAHLEQRAAHPFAYGCEQVHEMVTHYIPSLSAEDDPDGRLVMASYNSDTENSQSFWEHRALFGLCLSHHISVSFNDVSYFTTFDAYPNDDLRSIIDQADPLTRQLVVEQFPHLVGKEILRMHEKNGPDPEGMALSNAAIVKNAIEHIERTQSQIYIQQCGVSHVMGETRKTRDFKYEDSLTALFFKQGFSVLPVFPFYEAWHHHLPTESHGSLKRAVKITGMDQGNGGKRHNEVFFDVMRRTVNRASEYNF